MTFRSVSCVVSVLAAVVLLVTGCATNQSGPKTVTMPTPTAPIAPPAPAEQPKTMIAPKIRTAADIGMKEILDDPRKLAVLRKYAPTLASNPQLGMARNMTLADVAGYAEAGLSGALVKSIVEDINKL